MLPATLPEGQPIQGATVKATQGDRILMTLTDRREATPAQAMLIVNPSDHPIGPLNSKIALADDE